MPPATQRWTWQASTSGFDATSKHTMATLPPTPSLEAHWFDGRSARANRVLLQVEGDTLCLRSPQDGHTLNHYPMRSVRWPERTRHGARIAQLPDGGSLQAMAPSQWDAWLQATGHQGRWVEKAQLSWRATLGAAVVLVLLLGALWQWGLPWAAREVVAFAPRSVDQAIGQRALAELDGRLMRPSRLPLAYRQQLAQRFQQALDRHRLQPAHPATTARWDHSATVSVVFRQSRIGPNALALPDGTLVLTDELIDLVERREDVLLGVLAHEWGHVQARHSMRQLFQAGALGLMASAALGDFSGLVSALPVLLGQMAYSRELEREADDSAIAVLKANGISPAVMTTLFERLEKHGRAPDAAADNSWLGIAFSSHPATQERIKRFSQAAPAQ